MVEGPFEGSSEVVEGYEGFKLQVWVVGFREIWDLQGMVPTNLGFP